MRVCDRSCARTATTARRFDKVFVFSVPFIFFQAFGRPYSVAPLAQHVVCRLSSCLSSVCDFLYCGLYERQTADVCTYQGVFGDGRFNGNMQNVVGPTLVAMAMKFGLKSAISRLVWHIDRRRLRLPTRGFSEMADSMESCKMFWGRPLLPWQRNLN